MVVAFEDLGILHKDLGTNMHKPWKLLTASFRHGEVRPQEHPHSLELRREGLGPHPS